MYILYKKKKKLYKIVKQITTKNLTTKNKVKLSKNNNIFIYIYKYTWEY